WEETDGTAVCCTAEDFRIDITGTPHSAWNESAGRVFAQSLLTSQGFEDTPDSRTAVERQFATRLKSLRRNYGSVGHSAAQISQEKSDHNRAQRKYNLYQRRRDTAKLYPMLHDALPALDSLGSAGMSSDESDVDLGGRVYYIRTPLWRNDSLRPWLAAFDTL
ncbi:hypothetical protein DENSPDRAFT_752993, partial [Dentipellis sp. KUC8613]